MSVPKPKGETVIKKFPIKNTKGSILVVFVIMMTVLSTFLLAAAGLSLENRLSISRTYQNDIALNLAEAGINKGLWEIKGHNPSYTGETTNTSIAGGQFDVTVTPIDATSKYIVATGYVPSKANPKFKKAIKIKVTAQSSNTDISFGYAIQSGVGGTFIKGSAEVHGSLYSNGNVDISGSKDVHGDVWAHGTITDPQNRVSDGNKYPGAPIVPLPNIDFASWEALAKQGGTVGSPGVDYIPTPGNIGPKEYLGNFRYTSNGTFNIKGPIYVHGNVTINGGNWNLDSSLSQTGTVFIADGTISISGSAFGSSSGYIAFISTNGTNDENNPAIKYSGSTNGEKVALFAPFGSLNISGASHVVAMMGNTLYVNGGEIEYDEGMPTITMPPGGPGGTWLVKEWQEIPPP